MSLTTIPTVPTTGTGIQFNPPPGWTAPAGFDPRRGHLVDPTWPAAPGAWAWWVPAPRPTGFLPWVKRVGWGPLLFSVLAIVFVIILVSPDDGSPSDGVGSCLSGGTDGSYTSISCSDDAASYIVDSEVSSPTLCPASDATYFEVGSVYQCLRPLG